MTAESVRQFETSDISAAAELLAARHRRDRTYQPLLPDIYDEPATCRGPIETLLDRGEGVVLQRGGAVAGYLLAECTPPHLQERRAFIPLEGHAIAAGDARGTYRMMYAALAPALIRRGLFDHQIFIPAADEEGAEAWFSLTFGQMTVTAVRGVASIPRDDGIQVKECMAKDIDAAAELLRGLEAFHSNAPVFRPTTATAEWARAELVDDVGGRDSLVLLASIEGAPAGLCFARRPRTMAMGRFDKTLAVLEVYTKPAARQKGVATAMLATAAEWARAHGFEHLALDYMTANLLSSRFWAAKGFEPVAPILQRRLDRRIAWADGTSS